MLEKLQLIRTALPELLSRAAAGGIVKTLYIDYHKPYVSRIWFPFEDVRVFIHKIAPCEDSSQALYHPHKWDSAMEILAGTYEMGIGHSVTNAIPKTDCKLILPAKTQYEMTEKDGWHYVRPIGGPAWTLMITGNLNGREMPVEPKQKLRPLTREEISDMVLFIKYKCASNSQFHSIDWDALYENIIKQQ